MNANADVSSTEWLDPDDAPEWTDEMFDGAEYSVAGVVVRPARGAAPGERLTPISPGRPKLAKPKRQVTLRMDQDVLERFRADGPGWQTRINAALRKAVGI